MKIINIEQTRTHIMSVSKESFQFLMAEGPWFLNSFYFSLMLKYITPT